MTYHGNVNIGYARTPFFHQTAYVVYQSEITSAVRVAEFFGEIVYLCFFTETL